MGTKPEELERQIEQTRAHLGETLDELEQKLSPKRMVRDNRAKLSIAAGAIAALMAIIVGRKVMKARGSDD